MRERPFCLSDWLSNNVEPARLQKDQVGARKNEKSSTAILTASRSQTVKNSTSTSHSFSQRSRCRGFNGESQEQGYDILYASEGSGSGRRQKLRDHEVRHLQPSS